MKIHFVLICEGSSDAPLVSQLEEVCVICGAEEASGIAPEWERLGTRVSKRVQDRLAAALALEPDANLIFVHRDSDSRDPASRRAEIADAAAALGIAPPVVAVVPVQETEAWLLLDEAAIRQVAENPRGRVALGLPTPSVVERIARPKERLAEVLVAASELSGERLKKFRKKFDAHRRTLLQRLDRNGPVSAVPAWKRMVAETGAVIRGMSADAES